MSSLSSYSGQDHHVQLYCSRLAQDTYEVCVTRPTEPEKHEFSVVDIWADTEDQLHSERGPRWLVKSSSSTVPTASQSAVAERPEGLLDKGAGQLMQESPGQVPSRRSFYFDAGRGQYRTTEGNEGLPEDNGLPHTTTLKTARQKLIEILKTDEFFDEYSFLALMALLLAHMFRLSAAIFTMGCNAPSIIDVFVCVWRFVQNKVEDIMATDGGSVVGCKCLIFAVELLVIFICIFIFLWIVFIPVCNSLTGIVGKIICLCV